MSLFVKTPNKVDIARPPRLNFVPARFAEVELDVIVRRRLFYLVNGVFLVCALIYLGMTVTAFSADVFLKNSQLRLDEMRARQELFSEISKEEAHIKFLQAAKVVGSSSEVMWTPLIQSIVDTYPAGTATNSIDILPIGNLAIGPASSTPKDAVVQVNLFLLMDNYNSVQTWMDNLATIPGFSDSKLSSISSNGGTYEVKLAVFFNHDVLAKRNLEPITIGEAAN
jgi:Tfp pilus assembly protein PilN